MIQKKIKETRIVKQKVCNFIQREEKLLKKLK